MPQAPFPPFEAERLQAAHAHGLIDLLETPNLRDLVRAAAEAIDAPMAAVTVIEERRQHFKLAHGMNGLEQTSRASSFCAYAILDPHNTLNISDAQADSRVKDSKLVIGAPHLRSYLGVPLLSKTSLPLAVLCIIDLKPREFDAKDVAKVRNIANVLTHCIRLRSSLARVERQEGLNGGALGRSRSTKRTGPAM